jgi:hypothetical protein
MLHRGNEIQHGSAGIVREAVKNVARQIRVKGIPAVSPVNRAASPPLIFSTPPKLDAIMPERRSQFHPAFDRVEIQRVDDGCTPSGWVAAPAKHSSRSISASDSRPSTNRRAISLRHGLTRRWRVRNCPGGKAPGMASCKRRNRSLALASEWRDSHFGAFAARADPHNEPGLARSG